MQNSHNLCITILNTKKKNFININTRGGEHDVKELQNI